MTLRIASDLALPLAGVTEKLAFLGRTGSGKTYAAQKLAEQMHAAEAQFVVLDPVGVWFGLRLAADGKAPGLPIPVLGGLRGDVPLEPTAGALIANLVVDRGVSAVIDVSQFESDADKARFAYAFADRFFFRKKSSPSAVHVFIEEAQEFVPQNPQREEARMLHVFTRLLKLGRNFGIGASLLSQRPQEVNKKALNLAEVLFAFQLTGPQERKTVDGWIADKGIDDEDIAAELPKLAIGHAHVWSPAWLKISRVVVIARKETFDASSTPTVGKAAAARELSPIDLAQLTKDMAATIEKAKAEDPKLLRQEVAWLKAELAKKPAERTAMPAPAPKVTRVEVPALKASQLTTFERLTEKLARAGTAFVEASQAVVKAAADLQYEVKVVGENQALRLAAAAVPVPLPASPRLWPRDHPRPARSSMVPSGERADLRPLHRALLTALAQHPEGLTKPQVLIHAGYRPSGDVISAFAGMTRDEWILNRSGQLTITAAGLCALGPFEPLPTGRELRERVLTDSKRKPLEKAIFRGLFNAYPNAVAKSVVLEQAGYRPSGDTVSTFAKLVRLEWAEVAGPGELRAAAVFFE